MSIWYLQSILAAIRNYDYDHFDDTTIECARKELEAILNCDDYDLNELLKQFVEVEVKTSVTFRGA